MGQLHRLLVFSDLKYEEACQSNGQLPSHEGFGLLFPVQVQLAIRMRPLPPSGEFGNCHGLNIFNAAVYSYGKTRIVTVVRTKPVVALKD